MEADSREAALNTAMANVNVRAFALETAKARLIDPEAEFSYNFV